MGPRSILALLALTGVLGVMAAAQAADKVPASRRAMIFGRMLAYDGNLKTRAGDSVVLAIVHKPGDGTSEADATEMFAAFKALEQVKLADLPFRVVRVPFGGGLEAKIGETGADALYVCAGLTGDLDNLKGVSHRKKVLTLSSDPTAVQAGLSVAVYAKDDKSAILLNLPASKSEGAAFGGDVLRLAEVIR